MAAVVVNKRTEFLNYTETDGVATMYTETLNWCTDN